MAKVAEPLKVAGPIKTADGAHLPNLVFDARKGTDVEALKRQFLSHLQYTLAKDRYTATKRDCYLALAYTVRDHLVEAWINTQQRYYKNDPKRVHYLSMEYLTGRAMGNSLLNLNMTANATQALKELGIELHELREMEWDAGLGNGGLGRLASCFLDSMATLNLPAYGYGIRYEFGIFSQEIENGTQIETPDNWLRYGNPWEIARPEYLYPVSFRGKVETRRNSKGNLLYNWVGGELVMAMAYDTPIPGYQNSTVNTMRLWGAKSSREFDLAYFNHGDYVRAIEDKSLSENISRVLYPNDNCYQGKELRLKQEYFLVSATIQDIVRRYKSGHRTMDQFSEKVAIQLNDTHPTLAIPELMRLLMDVEELSWDTAWEITTSTFAYTNHTILPEALEKWPISLLERCLPRHLQIIYEINHRFLEKIRVEYPNDTARLEKFSLFEEKGEKHLRMANLCLVGSHKVNGVSQLHSDLLKTDVFPEFFLREPQKFTSKTNGITQRRWLKKANPRLSNLISKQIGDDWIVNLDEMKRIIPKIEDAAFRKEWAAVKQANKQELALYLKQSQNIEVNPNSLFDVQAKRMHEYKRQLLNLLHVIHRIHQIKENPKANFVPRTVMISGKAAPGYFMAKLIIQLIHSISDFIAEDKDLQDKLQLIFLNNYRVSLAERVIPATDLSEQISTAGTEASGTGNMKFALNGAMTIGTLDGANVEICQEVGPENIFIFGLTTEEVRDRKQAGYNPWNFYHQNPALRRCLDEIRDGLFCPEEPTLFRPIFDSLLHGGDHYMLLADFDSYINAQKQVDTLFLNRDEWTRKSILNSANMGKFSSDRTIKEYAKEIWNTPVNKK